MKPNPLPTQNYTRTDDPPSDSDGWPQRVCMTCGCVRIINPDTNMCRECDENLSEAEDNL